MYASWRSQAQTDQKPHLFMALGAYRPTMAALPSTADEMIARGCADLAVPENERERYLSALLLDVNGWASWCAYLLWTARLAGEDDDHLRELLAIRLAWEWIILSSSDETIRAEWRFAMTSWPAIDLAARTARSKDWVLQRAVEIACLSPLRPMLVRGFGATRPAAPKLQAAFCLDVRSEIFRRALEAQGRGIQTLGVAGFFGVPIEYAPLASDDARPHLPGLMAPTYRVTDTGVPAGLEATRRARLEASHAWKAFKSSSLSSFAYVDSMGLFFAHTLFRDVFGQPKRRGADHHEHAGLDAIENATRLPRITSRVDGTPLSADERCELAASILRTMGLTRDFARVVLLVGHGSETRNNAYGAGLDCGACSGQPGDVNARAAAALLNDDGGPRRARRAWHLRPGDDALRRGAPQHDDRRGDAVRRGRGRSRACGRPRRGAGAARSGERRDEARARAEARPRRAFGREAARRRREARDELGRGASRVGPRRAMPSSSWPRANEASTSISKGARSFTTIASRTTRTTRSSRQS